MKSKHYGERGICCVFNKGGQSDKKTLPLLTYWTRLYVLVLLLSLLVMAVIAGVWIKINVYSQHYALLEIRAEQMAEEYGLKLESGVPPERLQHARVFRAGEFTAPLLVQLVDRPGRVYVVRNVRTPFLDSPALQGLPPSHREVLNGRSVRESVRVDSFTLLRVGVPVYQRGTVEMALFVSLPTRGVLEQTGHLYRSLALITVIIGLAGWIVLYFISRKLTLPLRQLAAATHSIARGEYDTDLPRQVKERELQQLVESFRDMASQLRKLERLRSDLLAGVSHELRTPVTSIRGMIQAVKDKVVTGPEAGEFMRISLDEAKRLQKMVEDLLDFSSLEAGAAPLEKQGVDLSALVEEVTRQVRVLPGCDNAVLETAIPGSPVWITGDEGRIRQILLNLINNSLGASATRVKITLQTSGGKINLDVEDNGKGIDPQEQLYVFERFYRGSSGKVKPHGLGLGLTISRLLARAHGGDLLLLESGSSGTAFRLVLPA